MTLLSEHIHGHPITKKNEKERERNVHVDSDSEADDEMTVVPPSFNGAGRRVAMNVCFGVSVSTKEDGVDDVV